MPKTLALFVGINRYDRTKFGTGNDLKMCVADCDLLEQYLDANESIYLFDEFATKNGIIGALTEAARLMEPGDLFIWHHSGHGTYYDTEKGRVTIRVCHDDYLKDYEVAKMFEAFKKGVTIVTLSDTCYSQNNSRKPYDDKTARYLVNRSALPKSMEYKGDKIVPFETDLTKIKATVYNVSACTIEQVAYEFSTGGAFTSQLVKILKRPGRNRITTLAKYVLYTMKIQTCCIETLNTKGVKIPLL